jgi:hypothetical protein
MTFETLPLTARTLKATESRLKAIYDAAGLGLSGDSLALAAGMLPTEYRRLCDLDPLAALAAQKGKADAEAEMAGHLRTAARGGDAKAALEILKHRHAWVATQQVQIDVRQQISVLAALEQAQGRVIEGQLEHQPSASIPLSLQPERQATA